MNNAEQQGERLLVQRDYLQELIRKFSEEHF